MDSKQFAVAQKSTEQALVYILHLTLASKPWIRETVLCSYCLLNSVRDAIDRLDKLSCMVKWLRMLGSSEKCLWEVHLRTGGSGDLSYIEERRPCEFQRK